jgi:hypothetical protein
MKNIFTLLLMGGTLICMSANAQEFKEHISKEFTLSKGAAATTLAIYNIDGFIKVEGYSGDKVIIEMDETISADDNVKLETGKKEFKPAFEQNPDTVTAYIAEPFDTRPGRNRNWGRDDREIEYHYHLDFTVKVPFNMNLDISTVNEGVITVHDVAGILRINNVNEGITVDNAKSTTYAHTVNGQSSYYTINGDIKVTYPPKFSADLELKSMNGEFYTDFPDAQIMPGEVVKNVSHHSGATLYKLNKNTTIRIGAGGKTCKFETLNGNIYIKKQS